ncbi:MAG: GFA family protein [Salinisphaeraceae bacterium]|nr:GFA family protein [Salinisphaeraceae bacterium]
MTEHVSHTGGCHCGAVRFEIKAPANIQAKRCNCSICAMTGFVHLIVNREHFRLTQGEEALTQYSFNTHTAKHQFCKHCGIKSFYVPRSHPEGYSVNVNCLDMDNIASLEIGDFDGQNWEASIDAFRTETP